MEAKKGHNDFNFISNLTVKYNVYGLTFSL